jgi:hypothetical protein
MVSGAVWTNAVRANCPISCHSCLAASLAYLGLTEKEDAWLVVGTSDATKTLQVFSPLIQAIVSRDLYLEWQAFKWCDIEDQLLFYSRLLGLLTLA